VQTADPGPGLRTLHTEPTELSIKRGSAKCYGYLCTKSQEWTDRAHTSLLPTSQHITTQSLAEYRSTRTDIFTYMLQTKEHRELRERGHERCVYTQRGKKKRPMFLCQSTRICMHKWIQLAAGRTSQNVHSAQPHSGHAVRGVPQAGLITWPPTPSRPQ